MSTAGMLVPYFRLAGREILPSQKSDCTYCRQIIEHRGRNLFPGIFFACSKTAEAFTVHASDRFNLLHKVFFMVLVRRLSQWFIPAFLAAVMGCQDAPSKVNLPAEAHDEHEHEHHYDSVRDAIEELTTLRNVIRDSFAKNDQDAAHEPLHEVGHVLEMIPELAKKENVSAENQAIVEKSVETLMTAFGAVDKTMHGQEGSTYTEEAGKIDAALTELSTACGVTADVPATTPEAGEKAAEPEAAESSSPAADAPTEKPDAPVESPAEAPLKP
jgi:hypothetical protein